MKFSPEKMQFTFITLAIVLVLSGSVWAYNRLAPQIDPSDIAQKDSASEADENLPDEAEDMAEVQTIPYVDFSGVNSSGDAIRLSDYIGEGMLVVNFWASWCGPCKSEMADFRAVEQAYMDQDVRFLMVNLTDGSRETMEKAETFLTDGGYDFQNVFFDTAYEGAMTYGISSIPTTMFIDANGEIFSAYIGAMSGETLTEILENALVQIQ